MEGYGKRVLIVDDHEDILHETGVALMDRGYNVYTASDGFQGSEQMKKRRYNLVLVDYHMPQLNGLRFIELCRVMWPETPIILMSADTFITDRSHLVKGTIGCVAKPFELPRLIELVNQACRNIRPQGEPIQPFSDDRATGRPTQERDAGRQATSASPLTN
jgi:two-component system chemotaxis response regulator CheY